MDSADYEKKDLLRFLTCGSVDDGKSTLIGRLLYDSKRVFQDQIKSLRKDSAKFGTAGDGIDYALLMDGLSAEREQGITIDVAYRYFETAKRKFIIADTPGHEQYTRNMVTGASTSDLAVVLVDAENGVLTQSKRHTFLVSLLQIPHLVVAVNKMDLVDYSQEVFDGIVSEFKKFFEKLDIHDVHFIPVSALKGDNVVNSSGNMAWYKGLPLLSYLEDIYISADRNLVDFRFPVQYVIRPDSSFRGYAGRIESGTIRPGEEIIALPSGKSSTVDTIETYDGKLEEAFSEQSVTITLTDEIDISRGDMIVRKNNVPDISDRHDAMICWMGESPIKKNGYYLLKHTTRTVKAFIENINYKVDVNTLHREKADTLELNDIARVEIRTGRELFSDPYRENRRTGSFILIDPMTNFTVAAGMIRGVKREMFELSGREKKIVSDNISRVSTGVTRQQKEERNNHRACVVWLTGYSGAGKSTIARELEKMLFEKGCQTVMLDGDNVRHGLCSDLGFSSIDREKNIRRVAEAAKLFFDNGSIVICSFISPYAKDREYARNLLPEGRFFEVFVKCSPDVCRSRDPKGLYDKADAGEIENFTGVNAPYEEPESPEVIAETDRENIAETLSKIIDRLKKGEIIQ